MASKRLMLSTVLLLATLTSSLKAGQFGIKGGAALSNFWGEGSVRLSEQMANVGAVDEQNQVWFSLGVFRSRDLLPDFLSTQSEILYSRGGKSWAVTPEGNGEQKMTLSIDYLQMPSFAKVRFPFPVMATDAYFGPQISWAFRARSHNVSAALDTLPFFADFDAQARLMDREMNVIDLGFVTGLMFDFPVGPGLLVLDFRYQMGFLNVYNFVEANQIKNYSFLFMLGYAFEFGGGPRF